MMSTLKIKHGVFLISAIALAGCGTENEDEPVPIEDSLSTQLMTRVNASVDGGAEGLVLPESSDFANIPSVPNNPITSEKVQLGMMLFHETAVATDGVNAELTNTWSCASCHHVAAGFKSGVVQGIGEGGAGFGVAGEMRVLAPGFDKASDDPSLVPDVQPLTSPTVLNTAFQ